MKSLNGTGLRFTCCMCSVFPRATYIYFFKKDNYDSQRYVALGANPTKGVLNTKCFGTKFSHVRQNIKHKKENIYNKEKKRDNLLTTSQAEKAEWDQTAHGLSFW